MADAVTTEQGVVYARRGAQTLTGDLYRPADTHRAPVLVAVHGGGWRMGSPDRYRQWGEWLARRGIALFAIRYQLAAQGQPAFPFAVQDVRSAVRFLRAQSGRFGLDADRIGLIGDSAGAHLAALAALAGGELDLGGETGQSDAGVKAVVGVYGVYDLLAQWEHDQLGRPRDQIAELFLGVSPIDDKFAYFRASPISHATTRAPKAAFLIAWGCDDDIVESTTQSLRFVTALKQAGQFVRTVPIPGAPHYWIGEPIDDPHSFAGILAPKLLRFLQDNL